MKKRFTQEQMAFSLRQAEGTPCQCQTACGPPDYAAIAECSQKRAFAAVA